MSKLLPPSSKFGVAILIFVVAILLIFRQQRRRTDDTFVCFMIPRNVKISQEREVDNFDDYQTYPYTSFTG